MVWLSACSFFFYRGPKASLGLGISWMGIGLWGKVRDSCESTWEVVWEEKPQGSMMKKCCLWGPPELGTQAGVLVVEKHDNCEEAEGEEGEIFLFLNPDGNIAPYASH
ncbi:hypothetical protein Tco_0912046 [Tanacetum coccineum]